MLNPAKEESDGSAKERLSPILTYQSLPREEQELIDEAARVMTNAFVPHTGFCVGAAIRSLSGRVYVGCNVEFSSYLSMCAEGVAVGSAVSHGEYSFNTIAIIARGATWDVTQHSGPCGRCCQQLYELAQVSENDIIVLSSDSRREKILRAPLSYFFKDSFGPADCGANLSRYRISPPSFAPRATEEDD